MTTSVIQLSVVIGARFPLSSLRLAAVVEKSPSITGSKVAQRLLLEAYRFQAMTSTDAVDVDEHFPGNHRVKVGCQFLCRSTWFVHVLLFRDLLFSPRVCFRLLIAHLFIPLF